MTNKVEEVQDYLKKKGFTIAETTIVDMAIDLARRNRLGVEAFACEAKAREKKEERKKGRK